ncbi:DUF928 domain-containing protein [Microcoleus sp. SVA1_B6]|uniref:DUF928 domain-containing protein n=1 Tax=Microcoleus sp. SVA1_B6 TaxID=2818952 RepID=UPI002FD59544
MWAVLYSVCVLLITVEIVTEGIETMTHGLKRRTIYSAGIASLMLSVSLSLAPVALAKYTPPHNPSKPKETGTNTTRSGGCEGNSSARLTALVPFSHVGETISGHPTFTWFVPDRTSRPLQFRLFSSTGQLLYRTEMQSQPGIMSVALPSNLPQLSIGQSYQWQVVLVCDPDDPSSNVVAAAEIQVVGSAASLQTQLAAAQTPQQRIDLYAESGLWYDAIAEARKASETSQNQAAVLELLDALASSEAEPLKDWSERLRQIRAIEQQRQPPQLKP